MQSTTSVVPEDEQVRADLRRIVKQINDLDGLVKALLGSISPTKPWRRKLLLQLAEVDRHLQIVRMTISLEKSDEELVDAAASLVTSLKIANGHGASGRADFGTRNAVQLTVNLGADQRGCHASRRDRPLTRSTFANARHSGSRRSTLLTMRATMWRSSANGLTKFSSSRSFKPPTTQHFHLAKNSANPSTHRVQLA